MYKNNIRKYRLEKGLKIKELADMCGISVGYLSHLETGSRDNPSKDVMENISVILKKSIPEIFFPN